MISAPMRTIWIQISVLCFIRFSNATNECVCKRKIDYQPEDRKATASLKGHKYLYSKARLSWCEHEACAKVWGGHLTSVETGYERTFILNKIIGRREKGKCSTQAVFLGGRGRIGKDGNKYYSWTDGTSWNKSLWASNYPERSYKGFLTRVIMDHCSPALKELKDNVPAYAVYKKIIPKYNPRKPSQGQLKNGSCICKRKQDYDPKNRKPVISWNGHEYLYSKARMSWCEHHVCAKVWGGHLASVKTKNERAVIFNRIIGRQKRGIGCTQAVFLGGRGKIGEGGNKYYSWTDGTSWNKSLWANNYPEENYYGIATRIVMDHCSSPLKELKVDGLHYGIYKRTILKSNTKAPSQIPSKILVTREPSQAPVKKESNVQKEKNDICICNRDESYDPKYVKATALWNGHEYFYSKARLSWCEHEACAKVWGGHLTSAETGYERTFILNEVIGRREKGICSTQAVFLGGEGIIGEDGNKYYSWTDGTSWNKSFWASNYPEESYKGFLTRVIMDHCSPALKELKDDVPAYGVYKKIIPN